MCRAVSCYAEAADPIVRLNSAQDVAVAPKSLLYSVFAITNPLSAETDFTLSADCPAGWRVITQVGQVRLSRGEVRFFPLSVLVPDSSLAGPGYQVRLTARSVSGTELSGSAFVSVKVLPRARIKLIGPQGETRAYPGQNISYSFKIVNLGNGKDKIGITASSAHRDKVKLSRESVELGVGAEAVVTASVQIPIDVSPGTKHVITLKAASGLLEKDVFELATVFTPIYEKKGRGGDGSYMTFPAQAALHLSGMGTGDPLGAQGEFYTGGHLTEKYWASMAYEGPYYKNRENYRGFSKEVYSVEGGSDSWSATLGDTSVNLSELTVLSLYERGGKFSYKTDPFSLMTFDVKKGRINSNEHISGGKISGSVLPGLEIAANYYSSKEETADPAISEGLQEKRIASALISQRSDIFNAEGEYAVSGFSGGENSEGDKAWRMNANLNKENLRLYSEYINAGSNFAGPRSDIEGYRAYAAYRLFNPLWFWAQQNQYHNNMNADPSRSRDKTTRMEWGSSLAAKNMPYLTFSYQLNNTIQSTLPTDTDESIYTLRADKTFQFVSFALESKWGKEKDPLKPLDTSSDEYTGRLYGHCKKVSGWVGYGYTMENDHIAATRTDSTRRELGLSHQISSKLYYSATLEQEQPQGQKISNLLSLTSGYAPNDDMLLRAEGEMRDDPQVIKRVWRFWLTLNMKFDAIIPIKMNGALEVLVFQDENNNGLPDPQEKGVPGAIVLLDENPLTADSAGKARSASVSPGEHNINLDMNSLSIELAPNAKLPFSVNIERGKTGKFAIPMVRVCRIEGTAYEDLNRNKRKEAEERGMPLMRIVLAGGRSLTKDTFTNERGQYSFDNILPQKYAIKIDKAWFPARYIKTTKTCRILNLNPGENISDLDFGIVEKVKQVIKTYTAPQVSVIKPSPKKDKKHGKAFYIPAILSAAALAALYRILRRKKK